MSAADATLPFGVAALTAARCPNPSGGATRAPSHSLEKPFSGGLAPKRERPLPKDSKITTL